VSNRPVTFPKPADGTAAARNGLTPAPATAPSQTILEISTRLAVRPRPQVLDLGPICDRTIQYFLSRGCRVFVEAAEDPRLHASAAPVPAVPAAKSAAGAAPRPRNGASPAPAGKPEATEPAAPALRLDYPDDSFDAILLWDVMDYLPDAVALQFGLELNRVSRQGALILLYADTRRVPPAEPLQRYRLTAEGAVEHEAIPGTSAKRIYRENRDLFRLFPRFDVRKSTLLRSQVREVLLHRLS
jgi:hypothetical protein